MTRRNNASKKPAVPRHVAIIMDGNGRWAKRHRVPRLRGHREGVESLRAVLRACRDAGVEYLTVYAFSTENWARSGREVRGLMNLLVSFLKTREHELHEHRVRLRCIGRTSDLPAQAQQQLSRVAEATAAYTGGQLILALSYGAREELVAATRRIAERVRDGELDPAAIDENTIARHLYAPDVPDPDLLIRTSGEMRLSNFLLWQVSYCELYVTDTLWPDFRETQFREALAAYAKRQRRFGARK